MATKWEIDGPDIAEEVEALAILIRETDSGVLAFAMYQSVADREAAVRGIKERAGLPVEEVTLSKTRRDPIRELRAFSDSTRRCVFFYDVEEALPDLAGYANLQREALREVPHPVVFWVREPGFREIAKNAPDFWSWRSGVFDFRTKQDSLSQGTMQAVMAEPVEFLDRGDFDRRISLYEHLIREHEQQASPDTFFLARLHMKLTDALRTLGRYKDAEAHARQAVGLCQAQAERTGGDPASTQGALAATYSDLATILHDLGDLPAARREMDRAIEIERKHFEPDHPRLATSHSNQATILQDLGDLAGARREIGRAIEILRKHFEPDHPTLAGSHSNLAMILRALGDLPGARREMERAIEIQCKHFEPDHPTLATLHSNLALILHALGDLAGARREMERAIEIEGKHFEPDHPNLATRYNNLAHITLAEGDTRGTCDLLRQAYRILTKHFDAEHPSVRNVTRGLDQHCGGVDSA